MPNATFDRPDLSAFTGLDDLGLKVGQRVGDDRTVLACKVVGEDRWYRQCGGEASYVTRWSGAWLTYPTGGTHHVARERAPLPPLPGGVHVWRQDMSQAADPREARVRRCAGR